MRLRLYISIIPLICVYNTTLNCSHNLLFQIYRISCGIRLRCNIIHWLKKNLMNTSKWHVNMAMTFGKPLHSHFSTLSKYFIVFLCFFSSHLLHCLTHCVWPNISPNFVWLSYSGVKRMPPAKEKPPYFAANVFTSISFIFLLLFFSPLQSCYWKSRSIYAQSARMLHGNS